MGATNGIDDDDSEEDNNGETEALDMESESDGTDIPGNLENIDVDAE